MIGKRGGAAICSDDPLEIEGKRRPQPQMFKRPPHWLEPLCGPKISAVAAAEGDGRDGHTWPRPESSQLSYNRVSTFPLPDVIFGYAAVTHAPDRFPARTHDSRDWVFPLSFEGNAHCTHRHNRPEGAKYPQASGYKMPISITSQKPNLGTCVLVLRRFPFLRAPVPAVAAEKSEHLMCDMPQAEQPLQAAAKTVLIMPRDGVEPPTPAF
jgi:hypothetical protein